MTSKIYLSGPMTGLPEFNFPAFHAAEMELRGQGLDVVNPAEHEEEEGRDWAYYLRRDIRLLMDCNAIHMLTGWKKSRGASLEYHIAMQLAFTVTGAEE